MNRELVGRQVTLIIGYFILIAEKIKKISCFNFNPFLSLGFPFLCLRSRFYCKAGEFLKLESIMKAKFNEMFCFHQHPDLLVQIKFNILK